MNMRVALSVGLIQDGIRGGDVYYRSLARSLARIDSENEYFLFGYVFGEYAKRAGAIPCPDQPNFHRMIKRWPQSLVRRAEQEWRLPIVETYLRAHSIDIYHEPGPTLPNLTSIPTVVTFHDAIPFSRPELVGSESLELWRASERDAARRANLIFASSTATKNDLMEYLDVPEDRIRVCLLGVDREIYRPIEDSEKLERVRSRWKLPPRYLLSVGPFEKRRNWTGLLETLVRLGDEEMGLVLTGGISDDARRALVQSAKSLGVESRVRFTGYVPEEDFPSVYNLSSAFVYPSLYDGFNLPMIEAMACGVPIVVSDRGALPEIAGGAGVLVGPEDPEEVAAGVREALSRSAELRDKGLARAAELSWDSVARAALEGYRSVVS